MTKPVQCSQPRKEQECQIMKRKCSFRHLCRWLQKAEMKSTYGPDAGCSYWFRLKGLRLGFGAVQNHNGVLPTESRALSLTLVAPVACATVHPSPLNLGFGVTFRLSIRTRASPPFDPPELSKNPGTRTRRTDILATV
jgi:hypothetical protein